ncbi:MAG: nicotinate (nicotinamide) nucleotide adenylyltransferase [spirochete symbiont of Stewartia floridana]|nr:MAG: nicotinate (nicotinamide) nucleotide adenylyltransferase [spirochete symbiont of Stewartia floridana]
MRTAIFGGTFNPVHLGHLALAEEVVNIGYQRIIFIPAKWSSHGAKDGYIAAMDRREMLSLALASIPWAVLWDGELARTGPSYSIDSVDELRKNGMITEKPGFIIGDDLMEDFPSWKEADRLAESTTIIIGQRNKRKNVPFRYPCIPLGNPIQPYSSTQVRAFIAKRYSLETILPQSVITYIQDKKLYGYQ